MLEFFASVFSILAPAQLAIAGGFGGLARAIFLRVKPWDGLMSIALGAMMGNFISPVLETELANWLDRLGWAVDAERLPGFAAFVAGSGGVAIMGYLVDKWDDWATKRKEQGDENARGGK